MTSALSEAVTQGSRVVRPWEAVVPGPTRIPVPARAHKHTTNKDDTHGTQSHTPPARPPGLDDLLNSSNYQALTDRQIRSEQGC